MVSFGIEKAAGMSWFRLASAATIFVICSSKLGNNVFLGGQAGVVGHVSITDNVKVATRGGVSKSITES